LSTAAELAVGADESKRTQLLATINLELTRMRGLVENLMTLARADANDLAVVRTEVDLDDLIDNEVHRLHDTSGKRAEAIVVPVRVWTDPQRVAQALRNLVDNAERHARTTVRMTLRSEGDQAVIWVDNDGPVIEDADRDRIFERFVRLDDSRSRDAGGSGLGLAIARTGLQACGGDVSVVDTPDRWCRFEMRIPLPGPAAASPRSAPAQVLSGKLQTSD
jgi:signal transduction histidine kinase